MRRSKVKILSIILALVALMLVGTIVIIFVGKNQLEIYKTTVDELQYELDVNTKTVYVASGNIVAGEMIQEDVNVMKQQIRSGIEQNAYISDEDLGSFALISIPAFNPVYKNMVKPLKIDNDTREYEIAFAHLMTDQAEYDKVDIRIMFPNGEDYVVLGKKTINNLSLQNCVFWTYLNEDEILRMSSALIDAYTVAGTKIYTTRYIEGDAQEDAIPNYPVKAATLELINSDPNIIDMAIETLSLQARSNLESRLGDLTKEQLTAVVSGHAIEDTASGSVLMGSQQSSESNGSVQYDENGEATVTKPSDDTGFSDAAKETVANVNVAPDNTYNNINETSAYTQDNGYSRTTGYNTTTGNSSDVTPTSGYNSTAPTSSGTIEGTDLISLKPPVDSSTSSDASATMTVNE